MNLHRSIPCAAVVLTILLGACGDDRDKAAQGETYCDVATEVAAVGEEAPTKGQLDRLRAAAPKQIKADVKTAAGILEAHLGELRDGDTTVFQDPELVAAITKVKAYDAKHCDIED